MESSSAHVPDLIRYIVEVRMLHGLAGGDAVSRIASEHLVQQVEALLIQVWNELIQRLY